MTRSDLVEELAARFPQLAHRDAEFAVKALLDAMSDALVAIPEKRVPHFKQGKALREAIELRTRDLLDKSGDAQS